MGTWYIIALLCFTSARACIFNTTNGYYYNMYSVDADYYVFTGKYGVYINPCTNLYSNPCSIPTMACQATGTGLGPHTMGDDGSRTFSPQAVESNGVVMHFGNGEGTGCIPLVPRQTYITMTCDYSVTGPPTLVYNKETPTCTYYFSFNTIAACPVIYFPSPICHTYTSPEGVQFHIPSVQNKFIMNATTAFLFNPCSELGQPLSLNCGENSSACSYDGALYHNLGDFSSREISTLPFFSGISVLYTNPANTTACPEGLSFQVNMLCNSSVLFPTEPAFVSGSSCNAVFQTTAANFCPGPIVEKSYDFCVSATGAPKIPLSCDKGGMMTGFPFVEYGNPNVSYVDGTCGYENYGSCNSTNVLPLLEATCLNRSSCSIGGSSNTFGAPCAGPGTMAIRATCTTFYPLQPCEINNGGCDFQTSCGFENNTLVCGPCPTGTIGTGYTKCETTCGDSVCDATQGEDCVSCPVDCGLLHCDLCGDSSCDSGETCTSCPQDCGSCDTKCKDKCKHGKCVKGACVCDFPWTGPTCSSNNQDPGNVTIDPSQPNVTLVTLNTSDIFLISVKS